VGDWAIRIEWVRLYRLCRDIRRLSGNGIRLIVARVHSCSSKQRRYNVAPKSCLLSGRWASASSSCSKVRAEKIWLPIEAYTLAHRDGRRLCRFLIKTGNGTIRRGLEDSEFRRKKSRNRDRCDGHSCMHSLNVAVIGGLSVQ
jgi:hypothetical protein